jgi:hypothetical protein
MVILAILFFIGLWLYAQYENRVSYPKRKAELDRRQRELTGK